jgi:signal transduction histidine kinase
VIETLRKAAAWLWPVPRLRWLLLAVLLFVAALPGVAALGLRVYENALIRRTEGELVAQGAALGASAALLWPGAEPAPLPPLPSRSMPYQEIESGIDLRYSPVLPERPAAVPASAPADARALAVAARMGPALEETKRATLASILLLDQAGTVLNGRDTGKSLAMLPEVRAALRGQSVTVLRHNDFYRQDTAFDWISRATAIRLHHVRPIKAGGKVVGAVLVSRSASALFRGMWEDRGKIAAGVAAIFAMLVLLTAILARAIVRPVEQLSLAARALARGQSATPARPTLEVQEIRSLYHDFEVMAEAIARRSRYLRDFAAALSHEFKTPLAGIRGGIELLQDHGPTMSEAERARFLANIAADGERLSRLVSRLMELAKADMTRGPSGEGAALAPLLARLGDAAGGEGFVLRSEAEPALDRLAMDAGALETVLATLLENARQAGAGEVLLTARRDGGSALLTLCDNGPGVPQADRERIFDPFFTSRRESGGTGLGLPIARALVEGSGGALELAESESGACFVLTVPLAAP